MKNIKRSAFILLLLSLLPGCGKKEIEVADVPPPQDGAALRISPGAADPVLPPGHPPIATDSNATGAVPMSQQSLPAGSISQVGNPHWKVPSGWREGPPSQVRRASFVAGPQGEVDISVTAFPGSVGTLLQNVNRWRQQIGLIPMTANDLEGVVQPFEVDHVSGHLVSMSGPEMGTIAVSAMHDGTSWFFKMTGPNKQMEAQREAFLEFVRSVSFH